MVKLIKGDLLELAQQGKFDVIAHGCNCRGIMGAGIAKQIADAYPIVASRDRKHSQETPDKMQMLGTNLICSYQIPKIVNCYTQLNPGADFNISAFEMCMLKLRHTIRVDARIGIPKIGCGIGGGDWNEVLKVLEKVFTMRDITVVIYEPKKVRRT